MQVKAATKAVLDAHSIENQTRPVAKRKKSLSPLQQRSVREPSAHWIRIVCARNCGGTRS